MLREERGDTVVRRSNSEFWDTLGMVAFMNSKI